MRNIIIFQKHVTISLFGLVTGFLCGWYVYKYVCATKDPLASDVIMCSCTHTTFMTSSIQCVLMQWQATRCSWVRLLTCSYVSAQTHKVITKKQREAQAHPSCHVTASCGAYNSQKWAINAVWCRVWCRIRYFVIVRKLYANAFSGMQTLV